MRGEKRRKRVCKRSDKSDGVRANVTVSGREESVFPKEKRDKRSARDKEEGKTGKTITRRKAGTKVCETAKADNIDTRRVVPSKSNLSR